VIAEKGFLGPKTITYMLAQLQQKIAQNAQTATTETVVSTACPAYLEKYIKSGAKNDMNEVKKLQKFLATDEGFDNLRSTGFYGAETFKAVTDFQNKYATDVLGPWNNNKPTGYVYQTTKKKINELYCMYRAKEKAAQ
jgi:hypothetical protein